MDRAKELERVLYTQDEDFLSEASRRLREGIPHYGLVYAHQLQVSIGRCVRDLELIAKAFDPVDMIDQVLFLPL